VNTFAFETLRRRPDVEAPNLFASDAADRLLLDTAADAATTSRDGEIVTIDDSYGALTLGAAALHSATGIRAHQDSVVGERALDANAAEVGLLDTFRSYPLDAALLQGARVVLLRLPKSLDALDEIAGAVAAHAAPDVTVFACGMVKHMTPAMNDVLGRHFNRVQAGLARQKARVLIATHPAGRVLRNPRSQTHSALGPRGRPCRRGGSRIASRSPKLNRATRSAEIRPLEEWPRRMFHEDIGMWICAHGAAFAGTKLDIGTRFLLDFLDQVAPEAETAIDLGCGTGILGAALALRRPGIQVLATDQSAAAIASTRATAQANGVADRVETLRDDALSLRPDAIADVVLLNPPFHLGTSVHAGAGLKLIGAAGRVLKPGGELWTVFNSHLAYPSTLRRAVGPTRQAGRNAKFTVTVSTKARPAAGA